MSGLFSWAATKLFGKGSDPLTQEEAQTRNSYSGPYYQHPYAYPGVSAPGSFGGEPGMQPPLSRTYYAAQSSGQWQSAPRHAAYPPYQQPQFPRPYQPPGAFPQEPFGPTERYVDHFSPASPPKKNELSGLRLEGATELNILILGETGVGKSTFINAFVNYLNFSSLDDALAKNGLQCAISSSFTWQCLIDNDYVAKAIRVTPNYGDHTGSRARRDERDGTEGHSATQRTKRYRIVIGNTVVRLMDTPGIGDTRGVEQDKKNMDDILASLNEYDQLHGIIILLKPNNARLTVGFQFCLKELLTHLHRDAAKTIVFGFTNARSTNFQPGETYSTLKSMLAKDGTTGIQLSKDITYCFDSVGFRCLAAHKNGIPIDGMGDIDELRRSWKRSADETVRMLRHFLPSTTPPHRVAETWDLYRTRELVRILTVPMANITQIINKNIALQKDQQQELEDARGKGGELAKALYLDRLVYEVEKLDQPRTVCAHRGCIEFKDEQKHYKSICHDPCSLKRVEVDIFPCEQLLKCAAFKESRNPNRCSVCGHRWDIHLHITWKSVEKNVQVEDKAVVKRRKQNQSDVEIIRQALESRQALIEQYEQEREIIQKAASKFAVFLKHSAVKPWNDSKLAYLDHLIREEKDKVEAGGSDKRLQDLYADREQHKAEVETLTGYIKAGRGLNLLDQEGIRRLVGSLYALKLTGPDLEKVAKEFKEIQDSTHGGVESGKEKKRRGSTHSRSRRGSTVHFDVP